MTEPGILDRCGLSESATPRWTLAEDVEGYARHGFRAIGVWLHKLERPRFDGFFIPEATIPSDVVSSAADAIRSSGLEVSHLVLTGFYTEPELPDRIAHTLHATDVAASLGAGCVVVAPGRRNGRSYGETRDLAARALTEVFERATTRGVRLAVEPIISWQSDYMNTLGEALELVELVDHPSLGVFPDTFHLWRTGTLLDDIERAGARIFGVHLNDAVDGDDHFNRLPGGGHDPARRRRAGDRGDRLSRDVRQRVHVRPRAGIGRSRCLRPGRRRRQVRPGDGSRARRGSVWLDPRTVGARAP